MLPILLPGRWALTPPFHPCLTNQLCEDVSQVSLRDATVLFRRRYILCGTFRNRAAPRRAKLDATRRSVVIPRCGTCVAVPWRYQARCPTSSPTLASLRRRCPDFPPVPSCRCRAKARLLQSEPAITRPARQFHYSLELPVRKPHPLTKREGLRHPKYFQTCLPPAQYGESRGVAECTMKINARTLKTEGVRPPAHPADGS
jgi:hypothetical protein